MQKYILVKSSFFTDFEEEVNKKIELGYIPLGGVASYGASVFIQAMILKEFYNKKD